MSPNRQREDDGMNSHTYVECCDRTALIDRTVRIWIGGSWVRVCREGMGCTTGQIEVTE